MLASPHKDAACDMLDRTALEIVPIMFIEIKEVGG
jgi:hypothetical protein